MFLGNPGAKYENTRHNAGFMAADALADSLDININRLRFRAMTARCDINSEGLFLMKPQTYMNLSGEAVAPAAAFYKIPPERIIAVSDDTALPEGKLRLRKSGSSGGHNGLKSLIEHLGTEGFPRIRIGVGAPPHADFDTVDWVIGRLGAAEGKELSEAAKKAADAVRHIVCEGIDSAMNKFN